MGKIELRLYGNDVRLETLKGREVAELIKSFEATLYAIAKRDFPEALEDELFISLIEVKNESAAYGFLPQISKFLLPAYASLTLAINTGTYDAIPASGIKGLQAVSKIIRKQECSLEFKLDGEIQATIDQFTKIEIPDSAYLSGVTTIYPIVKRTGGDKPTIVLQLYDEKDYIYVKADEETTTFLAHKLYQQVGLSGKATWDRETKRIVKFEIHRVLDYQKTSITESFNKIRQAIGTYWDEVDDIEDALFRDKPSDE